MPISSQDRLLLDESLASVHCHLPQGKKIIVGLSGGVDSAVSIALLKELGYDVAGLFMKNWEDGEDEGVCPAEQDFQDVALTANELKVPYFSVNFTREYRTEVFDQFITGLKAGRTPNPDILCNLEIKFKHLLHKALHLGADALATGHYARCEKDLAEPGRYYLKRAFDDTKDQTYFLYTASQKTLPTTVFPLGNIPKKRVREIARILHLPVATKKDSTGICFIGKRDFRSFISNYVGYNPGKMVTPEGRIVGSHQGLAYYTIGQRKGLMIGGQGEAWFVAGKRMDPNELVVVQGEHPALYAQELYLNSVHWVSCDAPTFPLFCTAKIRYRQPDQECRVEKVLDETGSDIYKVTFQSPQRAITLEQSCVFYSEDRCLGGGIITQIGASEYDKTH